MTQVCRNFLSGYCKFGDNCRFVHPQMDNNDMQGISHEFQQDPRGNSNRSYNTQTSNYNYNQQDFNNQRDNNNFSQRDNNNFSQRDNNNFSQRDNNNFSQRDNNNFNQRDNNNNFNQRDNNTGQKPKNFSILKYVDEQEEDEYLVYPHWPFTNYRYSETPLYEISFDELRFLSTLDDKSYNYKYDVAFEHNVNVLYDTFMKLPKNVKLLDYKNNFVDKFKPWTLFFKKKIKRREVGSISFDAIEGVPTLEPEQPQDKNNSQKGTKTGDNYDFDFNEGFDQKNANFKEEEKKEFDFGDIPYDIQR